MKLTTSCSHLSQLTFLSTIDRGATAMPRDEFDAGEDEDGRAGNSQQNLGNRRNEELR